MTRAALFDWDGTLVDSYDAMMAAWHRATEPTIGRLYPVDAAEIALVSSMPSHEIFPQISADAAEAARLGAAFLEAYDSSLTRAAPGVLDLLDALRADGIRVGAVTSKIRTWLEADAEATGIASRLDAAVTIEDVTAHKPDPAPVRLAIERLAADAAVMIGDTQVDIAAGVAAGVPAIGVAWGARTADELLEAGAEAVAADAAELAGLVRAALHG